MSNGHLEQVSMIIAEAQPMHIEYLKHLRLANPSTDEEDNDNTEDNATLPYFCAL